MEPLKWKMKKSNERLGCVTREEEMNGVLRYSVNTKDTQNGDRSGPRIFCAEGTANAKSLGRLLSLGPAQGTEQKERRVTGRAGPRRA